MLSVLLRLTLLCLIGYGGYRVFKEQTTASFCRKEAKKLESRFENFLDMNSNEIHLRKMKSDATFCSWLFFAPAGKAFELQLLSKNSTSSMMRVPARSSGHYGLIQIQFGTEVKAGILTSQTFEVFGPGFAHYARKSEKDAMYTDINLRLSGIGNDDNPLDAFPLNSSLMANFEYATVRQIGKVFCDAEHKALLAYFSEQELPGAARIKHTDFAIVVVSADRSRRP